MSEPFDFEAFVNGTSLPRRKVGAYRVDHRDEIDRLRRERDALEADGDEREASQTSRAAELTERIDALTAEMRASRVEWTIRTLTPDEFKTFVEDDDLGPYEQVAMQSRPPADAKNPSLYADLPNLTADQWRSIAGVIGSRQWGDLVDEANALILSKVAVPDFSPNASATRKQRGSSEN